MRRIVPILAILVLSVLPAHAEEQPVQVTASYSIQSPIAGPPGTDTAAEEQRLKRAAYARATHECADLLASVAFACTVTGINVSTQVNQNYGQLPTIYVNLNVNMQVKLK